MRHPWLIFAVLFLFSGCGSPSSVIDPYIEPAVHDEVEAQENWYRNTRFGYMFQVPEGVTLYALTAQQTAVAASEDSDVVFLVDSETNFFTVRGIEDSRTPHEWLSHNVSFFYPTGDAAQRIGEIAGQQAIFLKGSGTTTSPARLIVFSAGANLIVISYEQETPVFAFLVETFLVM